MKSISVGRRSKGNEKPRLSPENETPSPKPQKMAGEGSSKSKAKETILRLLLVGDSGVGKTCILNRYVEDSFTSTFISTVGIDFRIRSAILDGEAVALQIWDTSGQNRFRGIIATYFRNAGGIMIIYDVTSRQSFDHVIDWIDHVRTHVDGDIEIVLVGNKTDLAEQRKVRTEEGRKLAATYHLTNFMETSALTAENIQECFHQLCLVLYKNEKKAEETESLLKSQKKNPIALRHARSTESVYQKCCKWLCFQ